MPDRRITIAIALFAVIVMGLSLLAATGMTGFVTAREKGPEGMRAEIFKSIYATINKAKEQGLYACCIEPPCTMCFLKGTDHEFTSEGKYCNCDKLIAEGREPCPQCVRGLCGKADACTLNDTGG